MNVKLLVSLMLIQLVLQSICQLTMSLRNFETQRNINRHQLKEDGGLEFNKQQAMAMISASAATAAAVAAVSSSNQASFQCERISFTFCSSMPYNFTRMPNFFGDTNQIEAAERAATQYELLIKSKCSRHLLSYLCELLAPMCLDTESMKKFEIYPCRSFCRQVTRDCSDQILATFGRFNMPLPAAFQCDQLRYESNGGEGQLRGPCHESSPPTNDISNSMSVISNNNKQNLQQQQATQNNNNNDNNYWPYKNELDSNVPPFITDNSPIDSRIIRPTLSVNKNSELENEMKQENNNKSSGSNLWSQIQNFGQQLAWTLLRHSNLLSVLTLVCLILVINSKRLQRVKSRVMRNCCNRSSSSGSSRKSNSSASSSGSQRKLAAHSKHQPHPHPHKLAISPSSSSRSLMLVASCDKSAPGHSISHKLISCQSTEHKGLTGSLAEPSQKLLHQANLGQRTTLINVNGTLERHHQQQHADSTRYHLMQSLGSQQQQQQQQSLINQHQYDYIQVAMPPVQKQSNADILDGFKQRRHLHHETAGQYRKQRNASNSSQTSKTTSTAACEPKMYSNILLSSPSHQILLFGNEQTSQRHLNTSSTVAPAPPPPSSLPPPLPSSQQQLAYTPPHYVTPQRGAPLEQQQRSFARRPSLSNAANGGSLSSRYRRQQEVAAGSKQQEQLEQAYANSFASSNSSTNWRNSSESQTNSSDTSSFSPPATVSTSQPRRLN